MRPTIGRLVSPHPFYYLYNNLAVSDRFDLFISAELDERIMSC